VSRNSILENLPAHAVAKALGVKTRTLARMRWQGRGPSGWFHVSQTLVVYPLIEVEKFLNERKAGER
jgi:hypothetical protein